MEEKVGKKMHKERKCAPYLPPLRLRGGRGSQKGGMRPYPSGPPEEWERGVREKRGCEAVP